MYTNLNELLLEFGPEELARLSGDPSGGNINHTRIAYAIENASNLVDSFLRNRFTVPFSPVPPMIKLVARELTIANLFEYANHTGFLPPTIAKRKSYAMYLLRQIQNGDLQIFTNESEYRRTLLTNKENENRLFNDDLLDKFVEL